MKTRKKKTRTLKKYAVGSGATGTIKNHMPDPNTVFRQNEIDWSKAKAEASSNPWTIGLNILGSTISQVGMSLPGEDSLLAKPTSSPGEDIAAINPSFEKIATDKGVDINGNTLEKNPFERDRSGSPYAKTFAQGTSKHGVRTTEGEFEGGEVLEYPDGQMEEVEGASHSQGGVVKDVPVGTKVHSDFDKESMPDADPKFVKSIIDYLSINGKTPAEAKKARVKKIERVEKKLKEDGTDMLNKKTHKRLLEQDSLADEINFEKQGQIREMTEAYNYSLGTNKFGIAMKGAGKTALKYAEGFTGGDLMSIAGTLSSGFAGRRDARNNAANDTPNENLYKGFADEALQSIDQAGQSLDANRAIAEKRVNLSQNKQIAQGRNSARGVNSMRALDAGAFVKGNQALEDIYGNFSQMMVDNLYKKSELQARAKQVEAQGATAADLANRQDKDTNDSSLAEANQNFSTAMQVTGKDLNANKTNRVLTALTSQLSKYGLKYDSEGNITKG